MKTRYPFLFTMMLTAACLIDANGAAPVEPPPIRPQAPAIALWDAAAPQATGTEAEDIPAITPYLLKPAADGKPRAVIIVCPGGGYAKRTMHEGDFYAHWLNELGIDAFVLRYRLGVRGYRHPVMLTDVARAVRFVRANAKTYGVDPNRIGVIGSSAGGHLASTILTHFDAGNPQAVDATDRESSRPDLGILIYPVVAMDGPYAHKGSREMLLGENPDPALVALLSNEKQVTDQTPPTFLAHSRRDKGVSPMNSMRFAQALDEHKVPYELHIYDLGEHGFGLGSRGKWLPEQRHPWVAECERWLKQMGFAEGSAPAAKP